MKIKIKVAPRSSKNEVIKNNDGSLKIKVTAAPTDNRANEALLKLLSAYLKIPKSRLQIIAGSRSKNKIIEY